jgi:uncharacterized repeat protein (TIGR01451 family)
VPSRQGRATSRAAAAWRRCGRQGSARIGYAVLAVLLLATASVGRLPGAQAYQLQTGALTGSTGTNGTAVQTFPSGLTATWTTSGVTTMSSLTNGMTIKAATSGMFTPGISATQAMPTFTTDGTGCALNGTCVNRGTLTLTFNRPVRNPVLHLAGLGASVTNGGQSTIAHAIGTITASSPGGATFGTVAANAVDLTVNNGNLTWDTTATSPSTSCATQTVAGQNGLAGCGSIPIVGTITSLVLRLDMKMVTTGGTNPANPGDEYLAGVSVAEDFGDAPASYDAAGAASAVLSDLRLGATADEDNATTANATTSPNAVAAGANANTPNGDGADEDALTTWPTLTTAMIGSPYNVTVPISGAGAAGQVCGWVDLNRNGTFDTTERACTGFSSGAASVVLTWTVPTAMSAGTTYARLRASYHTTQVQTPTGRTDSGEVEDYTLSVLPTITLVKAIPGGAPGAFDLLANGATLAGAAGNGGSSGVKTLFHTSSYGAPDLTVTQNVATTAVPITIAETPTGSTTAGYTSTYACVNAAGTSLASGSGTSGSVSVPASTGSNGNQQSITCTFTNTAVRALTLAKSVASVTDANSNGARDAGDRVNYTFTVTNPSALTATAVAVNDPLVSSVTCVATTLAAGASTTCTGGHTLTQAEVDAGSLTNTAAATATESGSPVTSPSASATTTITPAGAVGLTKSVSGITDTNADSATDVGDVVRWAFLVTNTGTVTLTSVAVADPTAGTVTCPATTLAPGASTTCTAAGHTVTQTEVDSGVLNNTATASGATPAGPTVTSPSSSTTTPLAQNTTLALTKTATVTDVDGSGTTDLGDSVTWSLLVTNTGSVTLTSVAVNDPTAGTVTCPTTTLAPGAATTCTTAAHGITQADVDAGTLTNTATASGRAPTGTTTSASASSTTPIDQSHGLRLVKSASVTDADGSGRTDLGDRITWSFLVTDIGRSTLSGIAVTDPTAGTVTCPATTLAPSASTTCTAAAHVITQADVDAGVVSNTATATATTPSGGTAVSPSTSDTPVSQQTALRLTKAAAVTDVNGNGSTDLGDRITWTLVARNTGTVTLTTLTVSDPVAGTVTCPTTTLAPAASTTCTVADHVITQADVDAGLVANSATATAATPGGAGVSDTAAVSTPVTQSSGVRLVKTAAVTDVDGSGHTDLGDTVTWTFAVTNTGTTTLTAVGVTDPTAGPVTCPTATLTPGAGTTCTAAAHTVSQADVDAGLVTNTATATATTPTGTTSGSSTTDTPVAQSSTLRLAKSAAVTDVDADGTTNQGDRITWSFLVTNTGSVTLSTLAVTDPTAGTVSCPTSTLASGASTTCTAAAHTVTQADVDTGVVTNTATAAATAPNGSPLVSAPSSSTTSISQLRALALVKSAAVTDTDTDGRTDQGDSITWSFAVTNTGTVTIDVLTVTDPTAGTVTCPVSSLAPAASTTCTAAAHGITQADVDAGVVTNTALAQGQAPAGGPVVSQTSRTDTPVAQTAALSLAKSAAVTDVDSSGTTDLGDTIDWSFVVTNTGTTTLTGTAVTDPTAGTVSCPTATLAPGASTTCTAATHTITQPEVDAGIVSNTATVAATSSLGQPVGGGPASTDTPVAQNTGLTLAKSAAVTDVSGNGTDLGDSIAWSFVVRNTGAVTLTSVSVADAKAGAVSCPTTTLTPGASTTCTATAQTITQADVDAGVIANTATASGLTPTSTTLTTGPASTTTGVQQVRGLHLTKSAALTDVNGNGIGDLGDTVAWTFLVTDTGTVTAGTVGVTDPTAGAVTCPVSTLAPGASTTCTAAAHTVTQAEVDAGIVSNTATAHGQTPVGGPVTTSTASSDTPLTQVAALTLLKSASVTDVNGDGRTNLGDRLTWSFALHNTGTTTLTTVGVTDPTAGTVTCPLTTLTPGATTTCTAAAHTLVQADVDAGAVANTASASGLTPSGSTLTSSPSSTSTPVQQLRGLRLTKSAAVTDVDADGATDLGDTITWSFLVTNTGTVAAGNVGVSDPTAGAVTCPVATLAPGASTTCTAAPHTITQAEVDAGVVSNTATTVGQTPTGGPVTTSSSTTDTPITQATTLALATSAAVTDVDADGATDLGDTVVWSFLVRNTGSVTLTTLAVTDPIAGTVTCPTTTLAPGASTTCTAAGHTVTQADVDAGIVTNQASAAAVDPTGAAVTSNPATSTTPVLQTHGMRLAKSAAVADLDGDGLTGLGDTVTWSFGVTNIGNVTVDDLAITDATAGAVGCPVATLAPGASTTCTAPARTLGQPDVDAGVVSNTATATGQAPHGAMTVQSSSSTDTPVNRASALTLVTSAAVTDLNGNGVTDLGDQVGWSFVVTNSGTVAVSAVAVTDLSAGVVSCPSTTLAPGASTICTAAPHTITQADVDAGVVSNTATATGALPGGTPVASAPSTVDTPVAQNTALQLVKTGTAGDVNHDGAADAGDTVTWTFQVTNTGTTTVTNLTVNDPKAGAITCTVTTLAPGAATTCRSTLKHTVTPADVASGTVRNTAVAQGSVPGSGPGSGSGSGGGSATAVSNASTVVVRVVPRPVPSPSGTTPAPRPSPTGGTPGHLPDTGAVALPASLALAASLLVAGLLFVGLGRRGRRKSRHL